MSTQTAPLRVAIDARLLPGVFGGVEQVVVGLAHGLSSLTDRDDEYYFLTYQGEQSWLEPHLGPNCRILSTTPSPEPGALKRAAKKIIPFAGPMWRRLRYGSARPSLGPPPSDGTFESLGADVVHFPMQIGFLTDVPSIYHPHDLQHLHFPQFFDPQAISRREAMYRGMCEQAEMVTVTSQWGRQDLIRNYELSPEKVVVVHLAPAMEAFSKPSSEAIEQVRAAYGLPERFILYPAQTWPHKNHIRLVDALALLEEERGVRVPLVCSGRLNDHYRLIKDRVRELGLDKSTYFVGYVSPTQLNALYHTSAAVVIPTLFEAFGGFGPLAEAYLAGVPTAVSDVTSLAAQAGGASLLVNPNDTSSIADAVFRLWTDETLRRRLVALGRENVARFSWDKTVRTFRAHYCRLAGRPLGQDERTLIDAPPLF